MSANSSLISLIFSNYGTYMPLYVHVFKCNGFIITGGQLYEFCQTLQMFQWERILCSVREMCWFLSGNVKDLT